MSGKKGRPKGCALDALNDAGEEEILALFADGNSVGQIARRYGVSRRSVFNWLDAGGEERKQRWEAAKKDAAEAYVEKAEEVLEDMGSTETPQHMARAKELANHYRWKAAKLDRSTYGDDKASLNLNLNLGNLHLDALRQIGSMSPQQIPEGEIVEAQLLPAGDE